MKVFPLAVGFVAQWAYNYYIGVYPFTGGVDSQGHPVSSSTGITAQLPKWGTRAAIGYAAYYIAARYV